MVCHADNARKFSAEADNSNNSREKVTLFTNAAKEYSKAAEAVTDPVTKASLMYLSASASQKAQMIQSIIQQYSNDHVLQLEQANRTMGKARPSGPISDVSDNLHDNRVVFKNNQSRLAGINKIPKFTAPSEANIVKDLLIMESKLSELGFRKTESSSSKNNRTIVNNIKISSDLGESFMVLKPVGSEKADTNVNITESLKRNSLAPIEDVADAGYGTGVKIKNLNHLSTGSVGSKDGSVGSVTSSGSTASGLTAPLSWAANTVMNWGVFATNTNNTTNNSGSSGTDSNDINNKEDGNHWVEDDFEDAEGALTWNEQSMFVPTKNPTIPVSNGNRPSDSTGSGKKENKSVASDSRTQHDTHSHYKDVMAQSVEFSKGPSASVQHHYGDESLTRSTITSINSAAKDNGEGVLNLLNSVKRLGEENATLLARIEQLTKLEEENKKIITDMEVFRMDYEEKFKRVKKVLKEYSAKYPHEGNPATDGLNAAEQQAVQEKEAAKSLAELATKPTNSEKVPPSDEKRLKDLEKTVNALVARLQQANTEIQKRDGMIHKLDPTYVVPVPAPSSRQSSGRPPSGGIPGQSSNRSGVPSSRSAMPVGALSPVPLKKQIAAPVARHAGTATLESLQMKTKSNF